LLTLDPSNAQVLTSVSLNVGLGVAAGMDVDPETGTLYVADGALSGSGTNKLYTLEPATGVLTEIGTTVPDVGLSGLAFIPEPSAVLLLLAAGPMVRRLSRRRARV
jgi:DNA-binding beta-propeller fold protein YncE